jgi:3-isopropylmalate/(R)-2-methylmalate dehydratase small subunit
MPGFNSHTGTALPLRRSNVDTDQIAPARFIPYYRPGGFANLLFADWRADPDFALNQPEYQGATILVAGADFGTGSSRESAVWAIQDAGFKVVISPRFGDIFRGSAVTRGLAPLTMEASVVDRLWSVMTADPWQEFTVDLLSGHLVFGSVIEPFELPPEAKARLISGVDDVADTLSHADAITHYEQQRNLHLPVTNRGLVH